MFKEMKMKSFLLFALVVASPLVFGQTENCDRALKFDTTAFNSDFATRYSVLQRVNSANYEEAKTSWGVSIPEYFSGNFDQFSKKRSQLQSMYQSSGSTELSQSYFQHALSTAGAEAYAQCLARLSNKPISVWISNKNLADKIAVTIKSGLSGNTNLKISVSGATPINPPQDLTSGSQQTLIFERSPKNSFLLVVSSTNQQNGASDSDFVELPAIRNFQIKKIEAKVTGQPRLMCAAGGGGSTAGSQARENTKLTAPSGFSLDTKSVREITRQTAGPGLASFSVNWTSQLRDDGSVGSLTGQPVNCEGNSGHTQGHVFVTYEAVAQKEELVEVK
jgi:hypothetical protein